MKTNWMMINKGVLILITNSRFVKQPIKNGFLMVFGLLGDACHGLFKQKSSVYRYIDIGLFPFPVTVTTRIMTFLVGNHSPSFATVTGRGDGTTHIYIYICVNNARCSAPETHKKGTMGADCW